jgi:predicted DNA-binding transcriptional regulator YafY
MLKQIERIERLHSLIRLKATGSPNECALKLQISERQLYNTLDLMRQLGAPIYFDRTNYAYCYEYDVECFFGFIKKINL